MDLKTPDYQGKERRGNGSRLKLSIPDYLKILTIGFSFLVAGITFYIKTDITTKALAKDAEASTEINKKQDEDITIIKKDIEYVRKDMTDIKIEQKMITSKISNNTKLLFKILGALEK